VEGDGGEDFGGGEDVVDGGGGGGEGYHRGGGGEVVVAELGFDGELLGGGRGLAFHSCLLVLGDGDEEGREGLHGRWGRPCSRA
jgi:hypothetical protein